MSGFFCRFLDEQWSDLQSLTIISFHNSIGDPIIDTSVTGNVAILFPVQNGAAGNCRGFVTLCDKGKSDENVAFQ